MLKGAAAEENSGELEHGRLAKVQCLRTKSQSELRVWAIDVRGSVLKYSGSVHLWRKAQRHTNLGGRRQVAVTVRIGEMASPTWLVSVARAPVSHSPSSVFILL